MSFEVTIRDHTLVAFVTEFEIDKDTGYPYPIGLSVLDEDGNDFPLDESEREKLDDMASVLYIEQLDKEEDPGPAERWALQDH